MKTSRPLRQTRLTSRVGECFVLVVTWYMVPPHSLPLALWSMCMHPSSVVALLPNIFVVAVAMVVVIGGVVVSVLTLRTLLEHQV